MARSLVVVATFIGLVASCGGGGGSSSIGAPGVVNGADLSSLALSSGSLTPTFQPATTSYTTSTDFAPNGVKLTATTSIAHATLKVNGQAAQSGVEFGPIALVVGSNSIEILVTAPGGATKKTYTVVVTEAANEAPHVVVTFPPKLSATNVDTINATGTASDPQGVDEVSVNGVLATTSDGFAHWSADVPLNFGSNMLVVKAKDSLGLADLHAADARVEWEGDPPEPLGVLSAIAVDAPMNRALVVDSTSRRVIALNLVTGAHAVVSGDAVGGGPGFSEPQGIALDGNRALVTDRAIQAVIAVDLATGERSYVSSFFVGAGPVLESPWGIVRDGDRAIVTASSAGYAAVFSVDLASGDRTIVSDYSIGTGPLMQSPTGIALAPAGDRALVVDLGFGSPGIIAVDLATGDRTVVSDPFNGSGPSFGTPVGITVDATRAWVTDGSVIGVFAVDLASGDRTIVSNSVTGSGQLFGDPRAIALHAGNLLVADIGTVLSVDPANGARTSLIPPPVPPIDIGMGPALNFPRGVALAGSRAFVAASGTFGEALFGVELDGGNRTLLSDGFTGLGPYWNTMSGVAAQGDRALVVGEGQIGSAIFAVDPTDGRRTILSDPTHGLGVMFSYPTGLAVDGGRAVVIGSGPANSAVFTVDLASGDRRILSDDTHGLGPTFYSLYGVALQGGRALVTADGMFGPALFAVDLANGDRRILSDFSHGIGPEISSPDEIAVSGDRAFVTGYGPFGPALFAVNLANGDRVIVSDESTATGPGSFSSGGGIAVDGDRALYSDANLNALLAVDLKFGQRVIASR